MATPASATLRSPAGYGTAPKPPTTGFTPQTYTPPPIPKAPETGVANVANLPRQSFLRSLLDPKSPTYLANRFRPDLQLAGNQLRASLSEYGDYSFSEDALGQLTPQKGEGTGDAYQQAYFDARSQAAAAGMLYSRSAEEAVGAAWHRLTEQERQIINQYSAQTSGVLRELAGEFSGVTNELLTLYGEDVRYALENPVLAPPPAPAPAAGGLPARPDAPGTPGPGTAITWDARPSYTPAQVQGRWGRGARLVQAGSGKWVVRLPDGGAARR